VEDSRRCVGQGRSDAGEPLEQLGPWSALVGPSPRTAGMKAARCRHKNSLQRQAWRCRREVAGAGTEQTRFHFGKQGVESGCDADCDAIPADRVDVLARAVVLVAVAEVGYMTPCSNDLPERTLSDAAIRRRRAVFEDSCRVRRTLLFPGIIGSADRSAGPIAGEVIQQLWKGPRGHFLRNPDERAGR